MKQNGPTKDFTPNYLFILILLLKNYLPCPFQVILKDGLREDGVKTFYHKFKIA